MILHMYFFKLNFNFPANSTLVSSDTKKYTLNNLEPFTSYNVKVVGIGNSQRNFKIRKQRTKESGKRHFNDILYTARFTELLILHEDRFQIEIITFCFLIFSSRKSTAKCRYRDIKLPSNTSNVVTTTER